MRRVLLPLLILSSLGVAIAKEGSATPNIIPNGDFSQGATGFYSDLPYTKPTNNCLWPGVYTIAPVFNKPQLHILVAPEPFAAPVKRSAKENVFFANAGGTEPMVVWGTKAKCEPNTRYILTFNCISLSGSAWEGDPPHEKPTEDWAPYFQIVANNQASAEFQAGCGAYYKASMNWDSRKATTVTVKIVRTKIAHGGGLIGISNIQMVPVKEAPKPASN